MNKKFISGLALVVIGSFGLNAFAQEASTAKKGTAAPQAAQTEPTSNTTKKSIPGGIKTSKITRGTVVSLLTMKKIKAAEAGALANKGALALMVGSRIVYVLKADGSSAGDDLARLADGTVGVAGKTVTKNSITVILADVIDVVK